MYDPNRPAAPDGMMQTTSLPNSTGMPQTNMPVDKKPVINPMNPWTPSTPALSQGSQIAKANNPNLNLGPISQNFNVPPMGGGGQGFEGGNFTGLGNNIRSFIDDYRNSIFEWLQSGRAGERPELNIQSLLGNLFHPSTTPTAPAPVAGVAVGEPNPTAPAPSAAVPSKPGL